MRCSLCSRQPLCKQTNYNTGRASVQRTISISPRQVVSQHLKPSFPSPYMPSLKGNHNQGHKSCRQVRHSRWTVEVRSSRPSTKNRPSTTSAAPVQKNRLRTTILSDSYTTVVDGRWRTTAPVHKNAFRRPQLVRQLHIRGGRSTFGGRSVDPWRTIVSPW